MESHPLAVVEEETTTLMAATGPLVELSSQSGRGKHG
jgi:hypothetical protein